MSERFFVRAWRITGVVALVLLAGTLALVWRDAAPARAVPAPTTPAATATSPALQSATPVAAESATPAGAPTPRDRLGDSPYQAVLLSDMDGAQVDLYLAGQAGARIVFERLTHSREWEDLPTWSPDGRQIAFVRLQTPEQVSTFTLDQETNFEAAALCVIDADGGHERDVASVDGWLTALAWSPDGAQIAIVGVQDLNANGVLDDARTDRHSLSIVNVATGETRALLDDVAFWSSLFWSEDGAQIVCTRLTGRTPAIYALDVASGESTRLVNIAAMPVKSPNASRFAYMSFERQTATGYTMHLHAVDIDGASYSQLTQEELSGGNLQEFIWSPDGARLLYVWSDQDRESDLYLLTPASGEVVNLTSALDRFVLWPRWSSDGAIILFSALEYDIENGAIALRLPMALYALDVASGEIEELTAGQGSFMNAEWRPMPAE